MTAGMTAQERIDAFMADLKSLCDNHGLRLSNIYDERIDLLDENGVVAVDIDIESFDAEAWVEKVYEPTGGTVISLDEAHEHLKIHYAAHLKHALETESPLLAHMKKGR